MCWWVLPTIIAGCLLMFSLFAWLLWQDRRQHQIDKLDKLVNG